MKNGIWKSLVSAIAIAAVVTGVGALLAEQAMAQGGPSGIPCGGITGALCPEGQICIDDPRDNCDPKKGGTDCAGICRGKGKGGGTSQ